MDRTFTRARLIVERTLSPNLLQARAEFLKCQSPVILMGRGKSGTRLMSWACAKLGLSLGTTPLLPAGDLAHRPFREVVKGLARRNLDVAREEALRDNELNLFRKSAYEACKWLRGEHPDAVGWGWKWPETYLILPYVYRTFPRGRYVHMIRDGRDVAFKRHSTDDPARPLGRMLIERLGVQGKPRYLQAAASWEFQVRRYVEFSRQAIPAENRFEMSYEEFCREPVALMNRLADFLGIPMTEACRDYVAGTLTDAQIGQHHDADPAQLREVEAQIGPLLSELGYGSGA